MTLTAKDRKILACLQSDGRKRRVGGEGRHVAEPLTETRGSAAAILDRHKLREVKVPQVADVAIVDRFKAAVLREPAIVSCFVVAGQFDFLL